MHMFSYLLSPLLWQRVHFDGGCAMQLSSVSAHSVHFHANRMGIKPIRHETSSVLRMYQYVFRMQQNFISFHDFLVLQIRDDFLPRCLDRLLRRRDCQQHIDMIDLNFSVIIAAHCEAFSGMSTVDVRVIAFRLDKAAL